MTLKSSRKPLLIEMSQPIFKSESATIQQESMSATTLHRNESATTQYKRESATAQHGTLSARVLDFYSMSCKLEEQERANL